jgi:hypothetical protein
VSELLLVTEDRCRCPQPPDAALVKVSLRVAGLLSCGRARQRRQQERTICRGFLVLWRAPFHPSGTIPECLWSALFGGRLT